MVPDTKFFTLAALGASCLFQSLHAAAPEDKQRPNVLLITVDDLNCSSTPMFGCTVPGLMPNVERLASEGILFRQAHVVSGASQVSRGGIMTGLYPHNSGIDGFYHTDKDIPTLPEILRENGYALGIVGKLAHSTPKAGFHWDMEYEEYDAHWGRDPQFYYDHILGFLKECIKEGKPFFMMSNSHDPHRPWSGSETEAKRWSGSMKDFPDPERTYSIGEVDKVPGFIPDLPAVRTEMAQYYSSVHRMDETVGATLRALKDAGVEDNTIVFFLSDNGMSMPFSKTNDYFHSTHTPLIVKWNGVIKPGSEDSDHFVSGIDFMPTVFEALDIPIPDSLDGKSYLPLLKGKRQSGRKYLFTEFTENASGAREPMRAVFNKRFVYIYNVWSNGERKFKSETMQGLTYPAMVEAAKTDPSVKERLDMFLYRVPEEFYDYSKDPDALHNLIDDPAYQRIIRKYRARLEKHLKDTSDPVYVPFINRADKGQVEEYMEAQLKLVGKKKNAAREDRLAKEKKMRATSNQ